jgi:hypothetical protein
MLGSPASNYDLDVAQPLGPGEGKGVAVRMSLNLNVSYVNSYFVGLIGGTQIFQKPLRATPKF